MDEIKDVIAGLIQNYEVIRDSEVLMSKEANSIESLSANSAYSSSVMRVLTTRLRCGVLYRFRMVKPPSAVRGVLSLIGEKQGVKRNCF